MPDGKSTPFVPVAKPCPVKPGKRNFFQFGNFHEKIRVFLIYNIFSFGYDVKYFKTTGRFIP
ncbi:Uncharacterized protein dnm_049530 [Desulfonema magnum]|uniref:Uncharacterized protein n=1 Tax=Desulfonema magnum TaxID=45655 RepID=A0A975BNR3_9BACT|nr:Uncharacterized protein dnm_049530 [Desulfonema magnum]